MEVRARGPGESAHLTPRFPPSGLPRALYRQCSPQTSASHARLFGACGCVSGREGPETNEQAVHKPFLSPKRKVGGNSGKKSKINANGREFCKPLVRARITQCPRRARLPASPAASHAHTTCSGPREPGVAAASTARRGRFERPRLALAPRPPRPPELRGACGRAACAPRLSARRRLSSVTAEPRAPPNPQVSERAKACKARRTR